MPNRRPAHRTSGVAALGAALTCLGAAAGAAPSPVAVVAAGVPAEEPRGERLRAAARAAVEARPELSPFSAKRAAFLFASPAPADRAGARRAAKAQLDRALEQLRGFQVDEARQSLAAATTLLEPDLGLEAVIEIDRERLAVAVAIAHAARDEKALGRALRQYAARFGTAAPEAGLWPPDLERRLATVAARAQTKLRVKSTPPGQAFVDGRAVGPTPQTVGGLPPGRHRVEVRAEGHYPAFEWARTRSARLTEVDLELPPALGHRLEKLPAKGELPPGLLEALADAARRDALPFVLLVAPADEGRVSVRLVEVGEGARVFGPVVADDPAAALDLVWAARAAGGRDAGPGLTPWALGAAGAGVAAAAVGVGLRLWARDTQDPLQTRMGALTQAEAFDIQDRAEQRATAGSALIGTGAALVTCAAGLFVWDLIWGDEE